MVILATHQYPDEAESIISVLLNITELTWQWHRIQDCQWIEGRAGGI